MSWAGCEPSVVRDTLRRVDLANLLGVNEMSVVGWGKDRHTPSPTYQKEIRDVLGVEP